MMLGAAARGGRQRGIGQQTSWTAGSITTTDVTVSGQSARLLVPEGRNGALCIYHHGSGETHTSVSLAEKAGIVDGLTALGWVVVASNAHGNNWGNAASITDYENLYSYVTGLYTITKVVHFGQSMGGLSALTTIAGTAIPAHGFLGIYPACSLAAAYDGGQFTAAMNSAYSIGNYATATAGYDPLLRDASVFANVPMRFYASAGDTVVPKADHTDAFRTLIAADPAEHALVTCTGDHGNSSHFQPADALAFFARCIT